MRSKYYERSHVVSVDFAKQTEISYIRPTLRLVVGGGFEPPKASPTDLQSVPFDHSGTPPKNHSEYRPGIQVAGRLACQIA